MFISNIHTLLIILTSEISLEQSKRVYHNISRVFNSFVDTECKYTLWIIILTSWRFKIQRWIAKVDKEKLKSGKWEN